MAGPPLEIGCDFGKDFKGKVADPPHPRPDHKKINFVMDPKDILNYPQNNCKRSGGSERPRRVSDLFSYQLNS